MWDMTVAQHTNQCIVCTQNKAAEWLFHRQTPQDQEQGAMNPFYNFHWKKMFIDKKRELQPPNKHPQQSHKRRKKLSAFLSILLTHMSRQNKMQAINFQSLLRRHQASHNDLQWETQLSMSFVTKRKPICLPNHRPASLHTCAALPSNHLKEPAGKSWSLAALTYSRLPQFW